MNNIANCNKLMEAFAPGVGRKAEMDNSAGAMLEAIKRAIYEITMATHLDDVGVITDETMEGLCSAADLLVGFVSYNFLYVKNANRHPVELIGQLSHGGPYRLDVVFNLFSVDEDINPFVYFFCH